jgi:hypothetical protein
MIYHDEAAYSAWLPLPENAEFDSRDGMGWIHRVDSSICEPALEGDCQGCPRCYNASTNPSGHVAARQYIRVGALPTAHQMTRRYVRRFRSILWHLFRSAYGAFPAEIDAPFLPENGVTQYTLVAGAVTDDWIQCYTTDGSDARALMIRPHMTFYFKGGTAFDGLIHGWVREVDYSAGTNNVRVRINRSIGNRLFYGMADANTARIVLCSFALPQSPGMFAHEHIAAKRIAVKFLPEVLNADGAYCLPDHGGEFAGFRIASPVKAADCVFGKVTFRLRLMVDGAWVDYTTAIEGDGDWPRLQIKHSENADFMTWVYLRDKYPAVDGTITEITDLLAATGATEIEISYWAECEKGITGQRSLRSPLCGNCLRDYSETIGDCGAGVSGYGIDADGRHWFCNARAASPNSFRATVRSSVRAMGFSLGTRTHHRRRYSRNCGRAFTLCSPKWAKRRSRIPAMTGIALTAS